MITARQFGRTERAFDWADLTVVGLLVALIYAMMTVAREWSGPLQPVAEIHLEARYLPLYALFSLARGVIAYGVSFLFTMVYGYTMARVAGAERLMLPGLDILPSIPVLGFLPAFVLGQHDFRLPGLGSYMSLAIERGDARGQVFGVLAMLGMIVFIDQLVWRPVVAWAQKFTDDETGGASESWLWERVRRSRLWQVYSRLGGLISYPSKRRATGIGVPSPPAGRLRPWGKRLALGFIVAGVLYGLVKYVRLLTTVSGSEWMDLFGSTAATFLRVLGAVALASLWTVPVGVMISRDPRWSRVFQPIIQMAASFPAPMIFPVVVSGMLMFGVGLGMSSVVLLLLGTQWYILFNVIAGASAIPRDLWEVSRLARLGWRHRWQKLILPAIFPSLLTGWITATGGAWNASIVAEYMKYRGQTLATTGLGAAISQATERGDFHVLAAAVGLMAATVVGFNRLVWRPLSRRAQTRFTLNA